MSNEQFFIKDITIDSLVVDETKELHDQPQPLNVDDVDFRASMIRRGEIPANADPMLGEIESNLQLANQLSVMLGELLSEYKTTTDRKINSLRSHGESYLGLTARIIDEIDRLQDSIVDFLVNSTHDKDVFVKIESLIKSADVEIRRLHEFETKIYTDRANFQLDIANQAGVSDFYVEQKRVYLETIRQMIGAIESEAEPEAAPVAIENLDQYINQQESPAPAPSVAPVNIAILSDKERALAQQVCPDVLGDYEENEAQYREARSKLGAIMNQENNANKLLSETIDKRQKYQRVRADLVEEKAIARQTIDEYEEKYDQLRHWIGILGANLKCGLEYDKGQELTDDYPAISELFTKRRSSQFSKLSDDDIAKIGASFKLQLSEGKLPAAAVTNPFAENILNAYKVTASQKNDYQTIAGDIKQDTDEKIAQIHSVYSNDATKLYTHLNEITDQSGISQYLLDLALSYDKSKHLLAVDSQDRQSLIARIQNLDQQIDHCNRILRSTISSERTHRQNMIAAKNEIENQNRQFDVDRKRCLNEYTDKKLRGPASNSEEDINYYMEHYGSSVEMMPVDNLIPISRQDVDKVIYGLMRNIALDNKDLDDCLDLQKKIQAQLVALRDDRSSTVERIDRLSTQIMTHEHMLNTMIKDGNYEQAITSLEVAVYTYKTVRQAYDLANPVETTPTVAEIEPEEELDLLPGYGSLEGHDDLFAGSKIRDGIAQAIDINQEKIKKLRLPIRGKKKEASPTGVEA